jgi:serine phosphatase RsbU (regulator of sigma subunit)
MLEPKHTELFAANRRGALVLGALLAAMIAVAIGISLRIYTLLDNAIAVQAPLLEAQHDLDTVVQSQSELQNIVRGYAATGDAEFLEPYDRYTRAFYGNLADFQKATASLHDSQVDSIAKEMHDIHASWIDDVARPLIRRPQTKDTLTRETLGKIYIVQLTGDTDRVQNLLKIRLQRAELELKHRIDEALYGGIAAFVVFGLISIVFVTTRVQMQDVIDRERSIVETLGGAFRTDLDELPGAHVGTAYISADSDAAVGGDLYDIRRIDARRGLVLVADVSGKGIEAAVNTAFVKYSIRALARRSDDPAAILAEFNRMFVETVTDPNLFVVGFVGVFDGPGQALTYASAGHSGAYLRRGGEVVPLEVTGPIVGLGPEFGYERRTLALEPGDVLLLATDGLSEARDEHGELLGDAGAMALFGLTTSAQPQQCADELVASVRARGGGTLQDDLALLVIALDGRTA